MVLLLRITTLFLVWTAIAAVAPLTSSQRYSAFTYAGYQPKYASALNRPTATTPYAAPFSSHSTLVSPQDYTVWSSIAHPNDTANPYGQAAWSKLWTWKTSTLTLPFTITASAQAVANSELVKPVPLPLPTLDPENRGFTVPKDFMWGFAGAALQIEGGIMEEGRGPAAFEYAIQEVYKFPDSPDVADMNYYLYRQDIARLAAAGVQSYSFSISWSRILPFGVKGSPINQQAIDHYNDVINTCLEYGIQPIVTLVHFDTPYVFYTKTSFAGYDHPKFLESYIYYGKLVLSHYADRVPVWISFNEPNADGLIYNNWASSYNVLTGHATISHFYREQLQGSGKFSIKFAFSAGFGVPLNPSDPTDVAAANRYNEFSIGYISTPLYLGQAIPQSLRNTLPPTLQPNFTQQELSYINGTSDFYGIDTYNSIYVTAPQNGSIADCAANPMHPQWPQCVTTTELRDGWLVGYASDEGASPFMSYQHLRDELRYIWNSYRPAGLAITEFGFNSFGDWNKTLPAEKEDLSQSIYYIAYLNEMLKAIHLDGVNMVGAIGWSYIDNWEWGHYNPRYGVQTCNRTTMQRSYKRAIFDYVDWFKANTASA